ncbi:hypothetical protein PISMIDRAFT_680814 [Pisolithus microcarpus 441]|uniref:Unplaced genomic scaffold scaffold_60, whole genome shotgun sequence n=1 Tax=Pisolithus microcarpus 441 TaxID=765257 RepID=A0A0C9Z7S8_9AGAM|nr:hypothetical protein PISMIDRAFT_680814 [Pisolithus microcarpus 441]
MSCADSHSSQTFSPSGEPLSTGIWTHSSNMLCSHARFAFSMTWSSGSTPIANSIRASTPAGY